MFPSTVALPISKLRCKLRNAPRLVATFVRHGGWLHFHFHLRLELHVLRLYVLLAWLLSFYLLMVAVLFSRSSFLFSLALLCAVVLLVLRCLVAGLLRVCFAVLAHVVFRLKSCFPRNNACLSSFVGSFSSSSSCLFVVVRVAPCVAVRIVAAFIAFRAVPRGRLVAGSPQTSNCVNAGPSKTQRADNNSWLSGRKTNIMKYNLAFYVLGRPSFDTLRFDVPFSNTVAATMWRIAAEIFTPMACSNDIMFACLKIGIRLALRIFGEFGFAGCRCRGCSVEPVVSPRG